MTTRKPTTVEDLVIFQCISSAIFMSFKSKGYSEEQVAMLLDDDSNKFIFEIMYDMSSKIDAMAQQCDIKLNPVDEAWMAEIANRAVDENLDDEGNAKYQSAQGYACAMAALRMATKWRGNDLSSITDEPSEPVPENENDKILRRAKELFDVVKNKYGAEAAGKAALEYMAEQKGVATLDALGFSDEGVKYLTTELIKHMLSK
jgi:hypothetical protein